MGVRKGAFLNEDKALCLGAVGIGEGVGGRHHACGRRCMWGEAEGFSDVWWDVFKGKDRMALYVFDIAIFDGIGIF